MRPPFGTYSPSIPVGHLNLAFFFSVFSFEKGSLGQAAEKKRETKSIHNLKTNVMEIITGRVTADATINTTKKDKQVVEFTIATNNGYRPKDGQYQEITNYFRCSYWLNTGAIKLLKKGVMVQLYGRTGINVYKNKDGDAVGSLTFHVSHFQHLTAVPKQEEANAIPITEQVTASFQTGQPDDVPF